MINNKINIVYDFYKDNNQASLIFDGEYFESIEKLVNLTKLAELKINFNANKSEENKKIFEKMTQESPQLLTF